MYPIIQSRLQKQAPWLHFNELPKYFSFFGYSFHNNFCHSYTGLVSPYTFHTPDNINTYSLANALKLTFQKCGISAIFVSSGNVGVVFKDSLSSSFYLFDSHSRNAEGIPVLDGRSILMKFQSLHGLLLHINNLTTCLAENHGPIQFDLFD